MLIGLPSTVPPKSSIAICAAVTEPWPVGVDAGPFMSVSTPILTISSETCAEAVPDSSVAAASAATTDSPVLVGFTRVLPWSGALAVVAWPSLGPAELVSFATILGRASTPSHREPDLAGRRGIVARQLLGMLAQLPLAQEPDQRLDRRAEIAALPHRQI